MNSEQSDLRTPDTTIDVLLQYDHHPDSFESGYLQHLGNWNKTSKLLKASQFFMISNFNSYAWAMGRNVSLQAISTVHNLILIKIYRTLNSWNSSSVRSKQLIQRILSVIDCLGNVSVTWNHLGSYHILTQGCSSPFLHCYSLSASNLLPISWRQLQLKIKGAEYLIMALRTEIHLHPQWLLGMG